MKSFITGINGFAGSYLAEILLKQGHTVYGLVQPGTAYTNIENIRDKIQLWESDLLDQTRLAGIFESISPDNIFHLAGSSSVKQSIDEPVNSFRNNALGGIFLLEAVRMRVRNARVLMVSSGEVYGNSRQDMIDEGSPLNPQSPYAASKAALELMAQVYFLNYGLKVLIARPFGHIGPRQAEMFFVPTVAKQIAQIEKGNIVPEISIGDINLSRDYTDVRDVAAAYALLIAKGRPGEKYNICSGNKYRLENLVKMMIGFSNNDKIAIKTDPLKLRKTEIHEGNLSNQKIRSATGWEPQIDIKISLRDTLDYWRGAVAKK